MEIKLDDNYRISGDGFVGCTLIFEEIRERGNKRGEKENYIFRDSWYYSDMSRLLKEYIKEQTKNTDNIKTLIEKLDKITPLLERVQKDFSKIRKEFNKYQTA